MAENSERIQTNTERINAIKEQLLSQFRNTVQIDGEGVDGGFLRYNGTTGNTETILPDTALSDTSTNLVENQAITKALAKNIKEVAYDAQTGILTFTHYDDTTTTVDLPLELLVSSGSYDATTKELVLVLANSDEIRIPASELVDEYYADDTTLEVVDVDGKQTFKVKDTYTQELKSYADGKASEVDAKIPTKTSQLTNDSDFINSSSLDNYYKKSEIDTTVSGLQNSIPKNLSELAEDATHRVVTDAEKETWNNKAEESDIPTNVSQLNNDAGYITGYTETDPTVPAWAKNATKPTYDYSEIQNTPTIPSTAGLASEEYINNKVTETEAKIPTKTSQLTNDSNFATETYVQQNGGKIDSISVNGTTKEIVNKNVDIEVPTMYNHSVNMELSSYEMGESLSVRINFLSATSQPYTIDTFGNLRTYLINTYGNTSYSGETTAIIPCCSTRNDVWQLTYLPISIYLSENTFSVICLGAPSGSMNFLEYTLASVDSLTDVVSRV